MAPLKPLEWRRPQTSALYSCPQCGRALTFRGELTPCFCGLGVFRRHTQRAQALALVKLAKQDEMLLSDPSALLRRTWWLATPHESFSLWWQEGEEPPPELVEAWPQYQGRRVQSFLRFSSRAEVQGAPRGFRAAFRLLPQALAELTPEVLEDLPGTLPEFTCDLEQCERFGSVTRLVSRGSAPGRMALWASPALLRLTSFREA